MHALSLRQPWAWLVIHAGKCIENRTWSTPFRGPILIHAAKGMTPAEYEGAQSFARRVDPNITLPPFGSIERGGVVGRAELVGVIPPCTVPDGLFDDRCNHPWHMSDQFGFVLANIQPLPFKPLRGELGFFKVDGGAL